MPECERLAKCIFFNDKMSNMPAMADMYKQHYCRDRFDECARFTVASRLGPEQVPANLFPNDMKRAQELVNK